MEPEGLLPCSQELATCLYAGPNQSSPPTFILFLEDPSSCYPSNLNVAVNGTKYELWVWRIDYLDRDTFYFCNAEKTD